MRCTTWFMIVHDSTAVPNRVHDDARDFVTAERFSATAGVESGKLSKSTWPRLSTHAHAHPHFQASFVYSLAAWHPVFWPFVVLFILITSVPRTAASRPKRPPIGCLHFFLHASCCQVTMMYMLIGVMVTRCTFGFLKPGGCLSSPRRRPFSFR